MRSRRTLLAAYLTSALVSGAIIAIGASADGGCGSGGCSWAQINFEGFRKEYDASGGYQFMGDRNRSAKNRFANRRMVIRAMNGDWLSCLNPDGNDANTYERSFFVDTGPTGLNCAGN